MPIFAVIIISNKKNLYNSKNFSPAKCFCLFLLCLIIFLPIWFSCFHFILLFVLWGKDGDMMDHILCYFILFYSVDWIGQISKFDAKQLRWRWWMNGCPHCGFFFSLALFLDFFFALVLMAKPTRHVCRPLLLELQNVNDQIDFSNEMDTMDGKLIRFKNTHTLRRQNQQINKMIRDEASQTFLLFKKKIV